MKRLTLIFISILLTLCAMRAGAVSFALDSVAEWGRFPRFCVDTYRWGDRFFNTYDSAYVVGTGTKFNLRGTTETWQDNFHFSLPTADRVDLRTDPSTTAGIQLTYLAVSASYDKNIDKFFGSEKRTRRRYKFGFDCSLMGVEFFWEKNSVGTKINKFGPFSGLSIPFDGASVAAWGIDAYYFFNHKRYSQAAAFNYSKLQLRSQGSFYAGLSTYSQDYDFDFSGLPPEMRDILPKHWPDYHYRVSIRNYGIRLGYAYNWVVTPRLTLCASFSPTVGLRKGYINSETQTLHPSLFNRLKLSSVWNYKRWFAGIIAKTDVASITDRESVFLGANFTVTTAVGYRFNLW